MRIVRLELDEASGVDGRTPNFIARPSPERIEGMKIATPLGEYPFVFQRLERRGRGVAVVGTVAGLESSVVLGSEDLEGLLKRAALPLAAAALLVAYRRRR
jgi:hypothetical protein